MFFWLWLNLSYFAGISARRYLTIMEIRMALKHTRLGGFNSTECETSAIAWYYITAWSKECVEQCVKSQRKYKNWEVIRDSLYFVQTQATAEWKQFPIALYDPFKLMLAHFYHTQALMVAINKMK